jgi:hypothetical protein
MPESWRVFVDPDVDQCAVEVEQNALELNLCVVAMRTGDGLHQEFLYEGGFGLSFSWART